MSETQFTRRSSVFAMTCAAKVNIRASAKIVWSLLTDATGFGRWNSTVTAVEGSIREGERLKLHVPGTTRTFTPTVSGVVPARRMIWSDGLAPVFRGVRTFVLEPCGNASTDFMMEERFSGVMFALTKGMLPAFRPVFEAYANDLKREAERVASEREAERVASEREAEAPPGGA
jgi:hypothetical protein